MFKKSINEAYGLALVEFGENENIFVIDSDLEISTKTYLFKEHFPERFVNVGIAEQNLICIASGMAIAENLTVFASSFAMFVSGRSFEQIRNSVCINNANVKIGASHAGLTSEENGCSHQSFEDIALMRCLPNMTVICPSDASSTKSAVKFAIEHKGPVYIRLSKSSLPVVYNNNFDFVPGRGITIRAGKDLTIITTGTMLHQALEAADDLRKRGIEVSIIDMPYIKPIDEDIIIKSAEETGIILTVEEHSVIGGLGSAVAEVLIQNYPVPMKMIGIEDRFGKSGNITNLFKMYGLTSEKIVEAALNLGNFQKKFSYVSCRDRLSNMAARF